MREDRSFGYVEHHLKIGWGTIFVYLILGAVLEGLHGFKVGWYLDVDQETRRTMLRLAHSHGVLLGLCNVALAATLATGRVHADGLRVASRGMVLATFLLPAGFFLGGLVIHDGDPGLGIVLVPIGAVVLILAAGTVALAVLRAGRLAPRGGE